jgi:hypothetical protein
MSIDSIYIGGLGGPNWHGAVGGGWWRCGTMVPETTRSRSKRICQVKKTSSLEICTRLSTTILIRGWCSKRLSCLYLH